MGGRAIRSKRDLPGQARTGVRFDAYAYVLTRTIRGEGRRPPTGSPVLGASRCAALRFEMQHHHAGWNMSMHPAALLVTARTLRFQPAGNCNLAPFEVALSQVRIGNRQSVIGSSGHSVPAVNLIVPNPTNSKKETTINLAAERGYTSMAHVIREFLETMTR
jgi:hypothetical protein